jgi:hypothetical protein
MFYNSEFSSVVHNVDKPHSNCCNSTENTTAHAKHRLPTPLKYMQHLQKEKFAVPETVNDSDLDTRQATNPATFC